MLAMAEAHWVAGHYDRERDGTQVASFRFVHELPFFAFKNDNSLFMHCKVGGAVASELARDSRDFNKFNIKMCWDELLYEGVVSANLYSSLKTGCARRRASSTCTTVLASEGNGIKTSMRSYGTQSESFS